MDERYEVTPRTQELGGGFKLQCLIFENELEVEMMAGVFTTREEAEDEGEDWLQSQSEISST